jgi:type III restriction enzyme
MRLAVNESGQRVRNDDLNTLTVIANENYEEFAKALQKQIEDECGVKFEQSRIKKFFEAKELRAYLDDLVTVGRSVYEEVVIDSEPEREFALALNARTDIKVFVKLPTWFKIDTPVGTYNPDWAIVKHKDDTVYMVRETKSTLNPYKLSEGENDKISCGRVHFSALGLEYKSVTRAEEV